jgi:hypothetical protein
MFINNSAVFEDGAVTVGVENDVSEGADDPFPEFTKIFKDESRILLALGDDQFKNSGEVLVFLLDGKEGETPLGTPLCMFRSIMQGGTVPHQTN